ncbi:MAG TPA: alpha/beta fold hydrolase [Bryobacterales bacterium]|nr:alpha/beta fold hydrolase [Bryobacterales bacterium]
MDVLSRRCFLAALGSAALLRSRADWARARERTLANMQLVMGDLPPKSKAPLDVMTFEKLAQPGFTRTYLTFAGGDDDRVPAFLLTPENLRRPAPAMLCLHQTTRIGKGEPAGVGGLPNLHYAQELAARGYVALAPDYPNFGDYFFDSYAHGYASATMKGIVNHRRAVDLLESLAEVDRGRIGCIGHSLGGHNTLFISTFDERIRAMVSSCGFNSFKKYYGGNLTGWSHKGYMPRIAERYGKDPAKMPFDFPDILIALAPRPLFINAPLRDANFEVSGVNDCVDAALPVYKKIFHAADRLAVVHPDAQHDFPPPAREQAYQFLEKWLGRKA